MSNQNINKNKKQTKNYSKDSGSQYHKEQASHVPDYDDNTPGSK